MKTKYFEKVFQKENTINLFFYFCIILNSLILFNTKYFPTQDGCSHAYNSNILKELLLNEESIFSRFFIINNEVVPNMFTNVLMLILNFFLPFNIAEKIILLIYFILFPILFKKLVTLYRKEPTFLIFLVFPFTHFCVLYYGFFNFAYGLLFLLLGMIHYAKVKDNLNYKNLLILFLIAISAYLSHIFSFLCFLMFILIGEGLSLVLNIKDKTKWQPKKIFFQLIKLASTFIIPIILTIFYFQKRPSDGKEIYLSKEELFSIILNGDIFKSFGGNEDFYSKPLIYLLFFVMLYAIISVFHFFIKMQEKKFSFSNVFFFFAIVLFYLFFTQPNADGYGGYINIRIALFAFLFIIIWSVIVIKTEFKFEITIFIVVLFLNYKLYQCKKDGITWLNEGQKKFESFEKIISEKSVIAPVFWAKDLYWLGGHFSNFIGAEKNCVVLENYEASTGYFPVLWKNNSMPLNKNGDFFSKEEAEKFLFELNNYRYGKVDYVLIYGDTKDIDANIFFANKIIETFDFIRSDNNITLYRSKKF